MTEKTGHAELVDGIEIVRHPSWAVLTAPDARHCLRLNPLEADWFEAVLAQGHIDLTEDSRSDLVTAVIDEGYTRTRPYTRRRVGLSAQGIEFDGMDRLLLRVYAAGVRLVPRRAATVVAAAFAVGGNVALVVQLVSGSPLATQTLNPYVAALVILTIDLAATALHESAHGLVLAHYGRRVRAVGFGFYWGAPCYFVDATEALLLPSRKRMLQSAAGPLADVTLAGAMGGAALITTPVVSEILLLAAALIWLDVLFNVVPLLELDGYWILADWLDRPELRRESLQAAWRTVRRPREYSGLGLYGIVSIVFGGALLLVAVSSWWLIVGDVVRELVSRGAVGLLVCVPFVLPLVMSWVALLAQATVVVGRAAKTLG